jgi:hypothetical protein
MEATLFNAFVMGECIETKGRYVAIRYHRVTAHPYQLILDCTQRDWKHYFLFNYVIAVLQRCLYALYPDDA